MEILLSKHQTGPLSFSLCGNVWVTHLHSINFSNPGEYSVDSGSKYRLHSKLGWCSLLFVAHPESLAHEEPGDAIPQGLPDKRPGKRTGLKFWIISLLIHPWDWCRTGDVLLPVGEFSEMLGTSHLSPGQWAQRPSCRIGWPEAKVYCPFPERGLVYRSAIKMQVLEREMQVRLMCRVSARARQQIAVVGAVGACSWLLPCLKKKKSLHSEWLWLTARAPKGNKQ